MVWVQIAGKNTNMLNKLTILCFSLSIIVLSSHSYAGHYDLCTPVPVDPKIWADKFINDVSAGRSDEVADYASDNLCIQKEQMLHVLNYIEAFRETEGNIVYEDLIRETNLGGTFSKLVYAIQAESGAFWFMEFRFWKYKGEFVAYEVNIESNIEALIPDW